MKTSLIRKPLITEKTLKLANEQNVFAFEVDVAATKTQIVAAIEDLFEVKVLQINTVVNPSDRTRSGKRRTKGLSPVTKKALVKLSAGQTIDLFDISDSK
ncbi:MAG TPA: 50S ribosomal protein L23 [Candidatus Woesebacteria bacterium]|nr:50S ribosomal protein L23 [Candidatus Woesebacteria bacterium]